MAVKLILILGIEYSTILNIFLFIYLFCSSRGISIINTPTFCWIFGINVLWAGHQKYHNNACRYLQVESTNIIIIIINIRHILRRVKFLHLFPRRKGIYCVLEWREWSIEHSRRGMRRQRRLMEKQIQPRL